MSATAPRRAICKRSRQNRRLFLEGLETRNLLAPVVANASFEDPPIPPGFPGYQAVISGWTLTGGGHGINPSQDGSAPFLNGLPVPHGSRVAFMQGGGSAISQSVSGFEVGKIYQLTYAQNERGNGGAVARPYVRINGELLISEFSQTRVNPSFVTITSPPFIATSTTLTLLIGNDDPTLAGATAGDNTLLLDNVQITEVMTPAVSNFSFESPPEDLSDNPWPGYGPITGWASSNTARTGITPAFTGPNEAVFLNGKTPLHGRSTALLQNSVGTATVNISQNVSGFVVGQAYVLEYYEAERGNPATAVARPYARVNGQIIIAEHDLRSTAQQFVRVVSKPFIATATTMPLELGNNDPLQAGDAANDNTLLVDQIIFRAVANTTTATLYDGSFESPVNPDNQFKQASGTGAGTLSGSPWMFAAGGGMTRNNSAFHNGAISAQDGQQFAILQHGASFSQTVSGFVPGNTHTLNFMAARRTSQANTSDTYSVLLDGAPIFMETWTNNGGINQAWTPKSTTFVATKDSYVLTFDSPDIVGVDETTFIDNVQLTLASQPDFGDAPDSYATLLASNGPRHAVSTALRLGAIVDGETDGAPSAGATGDGGDEDGVTISPIVANGTTTVVATVNGGPGRLDAWIDWNHDGDFGDAGEQIASNLIVANGANSINVPVPAAAAVGAATTTYARFRLSSAGGLTSTGLAMDGEVEDYQVTLNPARTTVYVDPTFTTNGVDPDGAGPATAVGFDAFANYAPAIAVLQAGGTVVANAGTVVENVTINKSLTIDGAGTGATTLQGSLSTSGTLMGVTLREFNISGALSVPAGAGVGILNLFDMAGGMGSSVAGMVGTLNLTTTDGADTVNFNGVGAGGTLSTNKLNGVAFNAGSIGAVNIFTFQTAADASDNITVAPDENTVVNISAGEPVLPVIGDVLNLNLAGIAPPLIVNATTNGSLTASGRAAVNWLSIEDVDISGVPDAPVINVGDIFALGSAANEPIILSRGPGPLDIKVRIGGLMSPAMQPTGKVIVHGGGGSDSVNASNLTLPVEILGQGGDDYISGASANDLLVGGAGNDRINGAAGDNVIWGDNVGEQNLMTGGNDQLSGLAGNDVFYGGGGDDLISAGGGQDYAHGGEGTDMLQGSDGDDRLYGGNGNDTLAGGNGNDLLSGGANNDALYGDSGNDVLFGGGGADSMNGSDGNDLLVAGSVNNESSSTANDANDMALIVLLSTWGGSGSNRTGLGAITPGTDVDTVTGGAGDDDFSVVAGSDVLPDFGTGADEMF